MDSDVERNGDSVIELKGIWFGYDPERPVFQNLDFTLRRGERVVLSGANGSGKTTLFHIVMGLLRSQRGRITLYGKPREKKEDFVEVRKRIGLLFQNSDDQLFCPTVEEDVAFGPLNLGKTPAEAKAVVEKTLWLIGLEGYEKRITYKLSEGEKRLVALATVLAMRPEVLLLDEPFSGLDEDHITKLSAALIRSATTYVVISHHTNILKGEITHFSTLHKSRITRAETG